MLKADSQPDALNVQDQRPLCVVITVSAHHQNLRTNCAQFIENTFRADIAKMPDLVRLTRYLENIGGQPIMRVRQNEDSKNLCSFRALNWWSNASDISNSLPDSITPLLHHSINPLLQVT